MKKKDLEALKDAAIDGSDGRVRKANKEVLKNSVSLLEDAIANFDDETPVKAPSGVPQASDGGVSYEAAVSYAKTHHITVEEAFNALYAQK